MRRLTLAATLTLLVLTTPARSAEFPDVDKLPSRPEMPDPLVMFDGTAVKTRADWFSKRRPELRALFEHYMYGKSPAAPAEVAGVVDREDKKALGGKATLKEVSVTYGPLEAPKIHLLLIVPNDRKGPVPTILGLSFASNHTVLDDPEVAESTVPPPATKASAKKKQAPKRGEFADVWNAETVVDRGYALAVFYCADVAPDDPAKSGGVFPYYPNDDWGVIAAWAWGVSRAADYLVTDPDVDRRKLAVVGHSRLGKAAILAGAFDERFALVFPHQSGCGGTAPSRGTVGESVKRINTSFPHWFNAEFKKFNDRPDKLPFDQNCLIAMVAPRPVLITCAALDTWSNPEGQFLSLRGAEPVYRLLGAGGLATSQMPETGKLVDSTLGYAIRGGNHSMTRDDWSFFLDFADRHFGRKSDR